jgi:hypothetical protein
MTAKVSGFTFRFAYDPAGRGASSIAGSLYKVTGIPTQYLVSPTGIILWNEVGYQANTKGLAQQLLKLGITAAPVAAGSPN